MSLKTLAEAIMLQAAEDFLGDERNEEDIAFFGGEGFRICSEMACMTYPEKCRLLGLISCSLPVRQTPIRTVSAKTGMSHKSLHV